MRLISDTALAAITIWQEARGEPYEGKLAVAEVIRNRMRERYASDGTVAGTVLRPKQFSGWNSDDTNRIPSLKIDDNDPIAAECIRAWKEATEKNTCVAKRALLYYAPALALPGWAKGCLEVARIGRHAFLVPH
ncbi:MAG TPA: cell wall hydrolase [Verrucomicrobiae bacterium]|nr:cell wall hydrolase [Verrucomicrobiae bacterium]